MGSRGTPITIPIRDLSSITGTPDEGVDFMPMPREMNTFAMPQPPAPGPGDDVAGARDVLQAFIEGFEAWLARGAAALAGAAGEPPVIDLAILAQPVLKVLNETLGEGEVAAIVDDGRAIRVQETVFAGVWRERHYAADGAVAHDFLLAAPIPPLLLARARSAAAPGLRPLPLPEGAMNVAALVTELHDAMGRSAPSASPHVINLTLLPLSGADSAHLEALLAGGAVVILSRGFGQCRITSTAARDVWRVQYYNQMQTLILDTIEVCELPEVALAAEEDLAESCGRLADLVRWMSESLAGG